MDDAYYNNANNGDDGGVYYNNADDGNDDGNMDGGVYYNNVNGAYYDVADVNGTTDISFDSYVVTTVNPGIYLLAFTLGVCFICFVIGYFSFPGKCLNRLLFQRFKRKKDKSEEDGDGSVELKPLGEDDASQKDDSSCHYKDMGVDEYIIDLAVNNVDRIPSRTENTSGSAWKETIDKDTGKTFYYDTNTLESAWIRPEALGKEKRRVSRLNFIKQKKSQEDQKNLASKERVYLQTLGRQRSMARKKVSMRANEEDNLLRWADFFRVFEFQDQDEARPQSAPAKINHDAYASFDDINDNFEDNPNLTREENDMNKRVWKETRKIIGLGAPWMLQSIIGDGSSIVTVMIISHYMGLREMICYSNVWFVIYTAYLINDAWYDTVYKHVNVSAAAGTEEGYRSGGVYLKIGVIGNFLVALPLSIVAVVYMPDIFRWIGYDESIVEISLAYGAVAAVNNIFDSTTGVIDMVLDIEGHAKFTAVFEFWDSLFSTLLSLVFVREYQPTLWEFGLFHLAADVVSTAVYFIITGYYKRWFNNYNEGFRAPLTANSAPIKKLVKMTAPLTIESLMGNVEYTVLTVFAAYQGTAEAASWVLLSYVWSVVGIAPDSFGAASSCHVARLLGQEDAELAKRVSWQSLKVGTAVSFFCSALLFIFRKQFVWCFSLDDTIDQMLYELIPYIALCQPFFTFGWTAMELNDALHLFKKAMISNGIVTSFITIPLGYFMTYNMHYNLEGIASAQCIGYTVGGVISIIFFAGADWDKAVRKAKDIGNVVKKNVDLVTEPLGHYDDYYWDDMPIEVRAAATVLGYNPHTWDNGLTSNITDYDSLTVAQLAAAKIMGYTREMY